MTAACDRCAPAPAGGGEEAVSSAVSGALRPAAGADGPLWAAGRERFPAEKFDDFLRFAVRCEADDVRLKSGRAALMKIHGAWRIACAGIVDGGALSAVLREIGGGGVETMVLGGCPRDFSHVIFAEDGRERVRFRVNVTAIEADARQGVEASLRRLPGRVRSFDDLEIEAGVRAAWKRPRGLTLVCGAPGSGKTWLLGAGTRHLLSSGATAIQAYEQPVEMAFDAYEGDGACYSASEVGRDVESFAAGVRASLRRAPDVLIIGEARDRETVAETIHAGDMGIAAFATTHARRCCGAIRRLLGVFPTREERIERGMALIGQIDMVIAQRLVASASAGWRVALREWIGFDDGLRDRLRALAMEAWTGEIEAAVVEAGTSMGDAAERAFRAGRINERTWRLNGGGGKEAGDVA